MIKKGVYAAGLSVINTNATLNVDGKQYLMLAML
jgi:hypothetical protein